MDAARVYAEANQAGVEQVARLVEQFGIDCDLTRAPAHAYTRQSDQRHRVEDEVTAAQRLGLPASLTDQIDLPFDVEAAVGLLTCWPLDEAPQSGKSISTVFRPAGS